MRPDLETLMAYVDGELPPQRRAEVEAAIAAAPELATQVETLYASRLPYQMAFSQHPPVPDALTAKVTQWVVVASASHDMALAGGGSGGGDHAPRGEARLRQITWMLLLLVAGLALGYLTGIRLSAGTGHGVEPWVLKVASYHAMYARETVTDGGTSTVQTQALLQRLSRNQSLTLTVPNLKTVGLQFVRAQQLQFEGQMVLQLVYLPEQGLPVALCLTPSASQSEQAMQLEGLQTLTWQEKGWGYVLIGDLPLARMQNIRRQLPRSLI